MANTALNRTVVALLTNKSGGNLSYGDVVILDNTNANGFTTTTIAGLSSRGIGVILEPNGIANNATGMVATGGWVPKINLNTASTVGQFLKTHTVAGQATPHSAPQVEGDFAVALSASSTPTAVLFGSANPGGTVAAVAASTDSDSDNTVHDDPELLLSVVANAIYIMEAVLFFTTGTSTTPDVKVGFTFPSGAVMTYGVIGFDTAGTALTQLALSSTVLASSSPTVNSRGVLSTAVSASTPVVLKGILRMSSTPGTLQFQFAQSTPDATAVVRQANSYISLRRVE